ncbi:MAG: hypothetical protein ACREXX_12290 [Gammaproteobacteria bacterium]
MHGQARVIGQDHPEIVREISEAIARLLKGNSAAGRPAFKPRKTARKRVIEAQARTNVVRELVDKAKARVCAPPAKR